MGEAEMVDKPGSVAMAWEEDKSQHEIAAIVANKVDDPRSMWCRRKTGMRRMTKEDNIAL